MLYRLFKKRTWCITSGAAVGLFALFIVLSYLFPWTELNCTHQEVDINSGRVRNTRYLMWVKIDEDVQDTWLCHAAIARTPAKWRRVNTFSPGRGNSPHYLYHSAVAQMETVQRLNELVKFTPAARSQIVNHMLELWHEGSDDAVEKYLNRLSAVVISMHDQGIKTLSIHDLPQRKIEPPQ